MEAARHVTQGILTSHKSGELAQRRGLIQQLEKDLDRLTAEKEAIEEQRYVCMYVCMSSVLYVCMYECMWRYVGRDAMEAELRQFEDQVRDIEDQIRLGLHIVSIADGEVRVD